MTTDEYLGVVEWIEDHWPSSKLWVNGDRFYDRYAPYPAAAMRAASEAWFDAGTGKAPAPDTLLARVRVLSGPVAGMGGTHYHLETHIVPSGLGGYLGSDTGPGIIGCAITGCDHHRSCHCDRCRRDPRYYPTAVLVR